MKYLLFMLLIIFTQSIHANTLNYSIIIEVNKYASQVHLFSYDSNRDNPAITELFADKISGNLAERPATEYLKKSLDELLKQLKLLNIPAEKVAFNLLGADGMRELSLTKQNEIYRDVNQFVHSNYNFSSGLIKSISGQQQGIYGWLTINYLEKIFTKNQQPYGVLDVDDNSTRLSFAIEDNIRHVDVFSIIINHIPYHIFSTNFPASGIDSAKALIDQGQNAASCYPQGNYQFATCIAAYQKIIAATISPQQLMDFTQTHFAVINRAPELYEFFGVEDATGEALQARINNICSMSWEDMRLEYADSGIPVERLLAECTNGIYLEELIYHTLHLHWQQLWVSNKAHNRQPIHWGLGVLIYQIISPNSFLPPTNPHPRGKAF